MSKHRMKEPNQAVDAATVAGALAALAIVPLAAKLSVYLLGFRASIGTLLSVEALVFGAAMLFYLHDRALDSRTATWIGRRLFLFGCVLPILAVFANYIFLSDELIWFIARDHPVLAVWFVISATARQLFNGGILAVVGQIKREERAVARAAAKSARAKLLAG